MPDESDPRSSILETLLAALDEAERALATIGDGDFRRTTIRAEIADLRETYGRLTTGETTVPAPPDVPLPGDAT